MSGDTTRAESPLLVIHWGQRGGGPRFTARMAEGLEGVWPSDVYLSIHRNAFTQVSTFNKRRIMGVETYSRAVGVLNVFRLGVNVLRTRRAIRKHGIRVVYSGMLSIWQSIAVYAYLPRNVMYVSSIHDPVEHPGDEHPLLRLCRWLEIRRADLIVTYSDDSLARLSGQIQGRPGIAIHHGVDSPPNGAASRTIEPRQKMRLLFLGRLVEYKGLDLFVDVVEEVSRRGFEVCGIVAGNGEVDPALRGHVPGLIDWRVRWLSDEDVAEAIEESDIMVLPYKEASQSGVYTLALTHGLPAVVTPVDGLIEQVRAADSGVISVDGSIQAIADSVISLFEPSLYERHSRSALEAAGGALSWEHAAEELVEVIRNSSRDFN